MLPELRTDRLNLRELAPSDASFIESYQKSSDHWRLMAVEPENYANGAERVAGYLKYRGSGPDRRLYDYVARVGNTPIGNVSLNCFSGNTASLGYGLATKFQRQGFAVEMAQRLIQLGFGELGLHRISAEIAVENEASIRVAEKVGMTYEGTARDCIWAQGRWWTEAKYAIIESDMS